jgi:hypothetical protein
MKRNLIAVIALLGLAANAAFAEPTLNIEGNDIVKNAPEATSYQAGSQLVDDNAPGYPFNP